MKRPTEAQICINIASRLRLVKPKCFWTHIANEQPMSGLDRKAAARIGGISRKMGKTPGVPDFLFLGMPAGYPIFWYEVKRDSCRLTHTQEIFAQYCGLRGIPFEWAASDDWLVHYQNIESFLRRTGAI